MLWLLITGLAHAATANLSFTAPTNMPGVVVEGGVSDVPVVGTVMEFDVFDLKTGMEKRDEHLREKVFAAKKNGDVKIRFEQVSVEGNDLKGKLQIKDVSRDVTIPLKRDGKSYSGKATVMLSEFALPRPSFMGVKVEEKVDISFKVTE